MVDIEVGRARMYFSVENRVKMGTRRLGYAKYNFLGPKRRRLIHKTFKKKFKTLIKTTSFWFV